MDEWKISTCKLEGEWLPILGARSWLEDPVSGAIFITLHERIEDVKVESYQALFMELIRE